MARRNTPRRKSKRLDWRVIILMIISLLVVLSMALAFAIPGLNN